MRPRDAGSWIRAWARAIEFSIARSLFTLRQVPILPTLWPHHARHLSIQKSDVCKVSPRPTEISLHVGLAGNLAVGENETERLIIIGRSGGDVSSFPTMNMAAFEPR